MKDFASYLILFFGVFIVSNFIMLPGELFGRRSESVANFINAFQAACLFHIFYLLYKNNESLHHSSSSKDGDSK